MVAAFRCCQPWSSSSWPRAPQSAAVASLLLRRRRIFPRRRGLATEQRWGLSAAASSVGGLAPAFYLRRREQRWGLSVARLGGAEKEEVSRGKRGNTKIRTSASGPNVARDVQNGKSQCMIELQWHVSKYVNCNGISPNRENCNGIFPINPYKQPLTNDILL